MRPSKIGRSLVALLALSASLVVTAASPAHADVPIPGVWYFIRPVHSGKCLDITGGSGANGARLQQWSCNSNAQQKFAIVPVNDPQQTYEIRPAHSYKCLDVVGASQYNGTPVQQWDCNSAARHQHFWFFDAGGGAYYIVAYHSVTNLEVKGGPFGGMQDGAPVQIWQSRSSGDTHQRFYFYRA